MCSPFETIRCGNTRSTVFLGSRGAGSITFVARLKALKPLRPPHIADDRHFFSFYPIDGLASRRVSLAQRIDRGVNETIANPDTRKRLLINRHIARMTPEEIARRFMCPLL